MEQPERPGRRTYLLVDGENIDATLGMSVLGRRPNPEERPRWERVATFAEQLWNQPVTALFFLNASSGQMPMGFVQALLALSYHPIPLSGAPHEKVVDMGIQRTLDALVDRPGDVLLASHDGDFLPQVEALLGGEHRVGLLAFREFANAQFTELHRARSDDPRPRGRPRCVHCTAASGPDHPDRCVRPGPLPLTGCAAASSPHRERPGISQTSGAR